MFVVIFILPCLTFNSKTMKQIEFILYVANQDLSTDFYRRLLGTDPVLQVPGMMEFLLSPTCKLGLIPEQGIARIITPALPHPATGNGIPRCELYLVVEDVMPYYERAKVLNALLVSEIQQRDWGHRVGYFSDPDGHVIAFADEQNG
jgi:catechol 2,3-dioxygenase-like lactoylglutathione lyase family enzyme